MTETIRQTIKTAVKVNDRDAAFRIAYPATGKPGRVILGDDFKFWVVTPAAANRLELAGYEYAS
jgi:hypothetical protein